MPMNHGNVEHNHLVELSARHPSYLGDKLTLQLFWLPMDFTQLGPTKDEVLL